MTEGRVSAVRLPDRTTYFALARSPRYSILFALPLLVAYEALAAVLSTADGGLRNGADVLLRTLFAAGAGPRGSLALMATVILIGAGLVVRDLKRSRAGLRARVFALMFLEACGIAAVFGTVVGAVTTTLLGSFSALSIVQPAQAGPATGLMLSLGAGLYEELFFRVLLVSGLATAARALLGVGRIPAGVFATVIGALIFSAFHYVGPFGDRFQLGSFAFRAISGVVFSALYLLRGFGITAWAHALYDVLVMLF